MSTDNNFSHPPQYHALLTLTRDLLEIPGTQMNLERAGERIRLRFKLNDPATGKRIRRALEIPRDDKLAASLNEIILSHRRDRCKAKSTLCAPRYQQQWRKTMRKRLLAACPHGRTVKRRLVLVFDLAADLGYVFLKEFLERRPWLVGSPFHAGRRRKRP